MNKKHLMFSLGLCLFFIIPNETFSQIVGFPWGGSNFESRITSFTSKLVSTLLPVCGILGLVYACILALIGDGSARQRIIMVVVCSAIGFLAPVIIPWIKSIAGY